MKNLILLLVFGTLIIMSCGKHNGDIAPVKVDTNGRGAFVKDSTGISGYYSGKFIWVHDTTNLSGVYFITDSSITGVRLTLMDTSSLIMVSDNAFIHDTVNKQQSASYYLNADAYFTLYNGAKKYHGFGYDVYWYRANDSVYIYANNGFSGYSNAQLGFNGKK